MASLAFPSPSLADDVVLPRPWRESDVPAQLEACGPDNRASQRVAHRCGFTREGVLRSHMPFKGGRRDTVLFSLLPGELR